MFKRISNLFQKKKPIKLPEQDCSVIQISPEEEENLKKALSYIVRMQKDKRKLIIDPDHLLFMLQALPIDCIKNHSLYILALAKHNKYIDVIEFLLREDEKLRDHSLVEIEYLNLEIVKLCIDHGANIKIKNNRGYSLIEQICDAKSSNPDLLSIADLLIKEADINIKNNSLFLAINSNKEDFLLKLLIDNQANVNCQNRDGVTPLHHACKNSNIAAIRLLLERGANVNKTCHEGQSPLQGLTKSDYYPNIQTLLQYNADVNHQDLLGNSVFHHLFERMNSTRLE